MHGRRLTQRFSRLAALAVGITVVASSAAALGASTSVKAAGVGFVQASSFSTGTRVASLPVQMSTAVGAGDLLVGWFAEYNAPGHLTVADSVNGAWTRGSASLTFGGGDVALYYKANSQAAPSGVTVTVTAPAAAYLEGSVAEYSGLALNAPLDQMSVASGVGTAVDSGATAATPAGDLVFASLMTGGSPQADTPGTSAGQPYTQRSTTGSGSAFSEDILVGAAGAQHGTATLTASTDWYAVAATFSVAPTGAMPPSQPANLAAPSVSAHQVSLTWTASTDNVPVTSYSVFRNNVLVGTTPTPSFTDTTVAPSSNYSYTVTASNGAAQTSPPSTALPVTTPVAPPPSITFVQSNTITTGTQVASVTMPLSQAVGAGDLLVGWFSLYSPTGKVQVSDNLNGAWTRGPSALAFQNDTGDIALYYKENSKASPTGVTVTVAASTGTGYLTGVAGEYSDVALAGALDTMSAARDISTALNTGPTGPANTNEFVYNAAMIDTPAGFTQSLTPGSSQGVAFTPRAQTSNLSTYEADILTPNAGVQQGLATLGASADWYSAAAVFRQLPGGTTAAPTVPGGLAVPSVSSTRVTLTWSPATDASTPVTGYTVYRNGVSVGTTPSNGTTFIDVTTAGSTVYTYTVDAFNGNGQHSAPSVGLGVTTPASSPRFIEGAAVSLATRQASLQIVLSKPVAAGDLLMGWYGQYNVPGQVQVSDNVNGAWTRSSATETFQGNGDIALMYVQNSKASPGGVTITVSVPPGANAYLQEVVAHFTGVATTGALDQAVVAESKSGNAASAGPTAAVPAGELVVGAMITGGQPGTVTPGSSAGIPYITDVQNGSASSTLSDILSSTAAPQTANAELGTGGDWYMVVATFRTAAPPPPPPAFSPQGVTAPQVAVSPDGSREAVVWRRTDGTLGGALYTAGAWTGPAAYPQFGTVASSPSVTYTKDGSTELVYWQGPNNHLMEAWLAGGTWNGPADITATVGNRGLLASAPSATVSADGSTQLVFWRGTDGHLWEAWFTGAWNGPADFTTLGTLAGAPSVAVTPDGSQQLVFWQAPDGNLAEAWFTTSWHGPAEFPAMGRLGSSPSASVTPDGSTQLVFWRTSDGHLHEGWYAGGWHGPIDLTAQSFNGAGLLTSAPSARALPGGNQVVFWQGSGNTLWQAQYSGGKWAATNLSA